jgi:alpha,alpha-trehalase
MAIAGERFRESYYWDSLWILKGLVASKMWTSAANLVQNMLSLVEAYGFVPNGCRVCFGNAVHCTFLASVDCCSMQTHHSGAI